MHKAVRIHNFSDYHQIIRTKFLLWGGFFPCFLGAGQATEKNKHFWENTGRKGELRNIRTGRRDFKRGSGSHQRQHSMQSCKLASKVSNTDEMQAVMNILTFVFNPWILDTVTNTLCIFLGNSSSIKLDQLPIFRKFEMHICQKYLCRLNYLKQIHNKVSN